jgi:hypothetical protein
VSNVALIVLVVGAVVTVLWLVALTAVTVQRAGRAIDQATTSAARLTEASAAIAEHQSVTQRELDRLGDSMERVRSGRSGRAGKQAGW